MDSDPNETNPDSVVLLRETRTITVLTVPDRSSWFIVIASDFTSPEGRETKLGATPFGFFGVRMAKSLGVHDGGGRILNSFGEGNEAQIFRRPARWCDTTGRIDNSENSFASIAVFDHKSNPMDPTPFHVRDDSWMGACLNLDRDIIVRSDIPLRTRYGIWVHDDSPSSEAIGEIGKKFGF